MKLYHGSSTCYLNSILAGGIAPKGERGEAGNWEKFPSRLDMVYLTVAYPFYFAMCAAGETSDRDGEHYDPVVFEIESDELEQDLFFPDEDFIAQVLAQQEKMSLDDVHDYVRDNLENWQDLWKESVDGMGNCCYQGVIPRAAIKRYCVFHKKERPQLAISFLDPSISLLNYRFLGGKHRGFVEWMFQDRELIPNAENPWGIPEIKTDNTVDEIAQKQIEYWRGESMNRIGIDLVSKLD